MFEYFKPLEERKHGDVGKTERRTEPERTRIFLQFAEASFEKKHRIENAFELPCLLRRILLEDQFVHEREKDAVSICINAF